MLVCALELNDKVSVCDITFPTHAALMFNPRVRAKVALLSRAIMPRQISVEELSDMMKLAGGEGEAAEGGFQFVDVREEDELQKAKIDGEQVDLIHARSVDTHGYLIYIRIYLA